MTLIQPVSQMRFNLNEFSIFFVIRTFFALCDITREIDRFSEPSFEYRVFKSSLFVRYENTS